MAAYELVAVARLRRSLALRLFLRGALRTLAAAALVLGLAAMAAQALGWPERPGPALLGALLGTALGAGGLAALRKVPGPAGLRARIDRSHGCGGLLMAAGEVEAGPWQDRLDGLAPPAVTWRGGRTLLTAGLSLAFLAGSLLLPREGFTPPAPPLEIGRQAADLAARIDLLAESRILPPERAEALRQGIARLAQQARGDDPSRTWEALDHIAETVEEQADRAADQAARQAEKARQGGALAEALALNERGLDPRRLGEAMQALADLAREAGLEQAALELADQMRPDAFAGTEGCPGLPDAAALRALAQGFVERSAACRELAARLAERLDPDALERVLAGSPAWDPRDLAALLPADAEAVASLLARGPAGRGAPTRGPGSAPLCAGEPEEIRARFEAVALPPAAVAREQSRLVGLSRGAPPAAEGAGSAGGALAGATAGPGSAERAAILPRHRKTVERFFERSGR